MAKSFQEMYESGIKLEYFSKLYKTWKPVLGSDNPSKLVKCGYELRVSE